MTEVNNYYKGHTPENKSRVARRKCFEEQWDTGIKKSNSISSVLMHKQLTEAGIDATLILDASIGYIMEQVDIVMIGAEGVAESGGIINKVSIRAKKYKENICALL